MIEPGVLAVFFGAAVLLALAPGPDNLFVLAQSALHGRVAGILVTLGLCTGLVAHTAAVVLGVAALIQTSAAAFTVIKLAGAAYLLWLAGQAFRASATVTADAPLLRLRGAQLYRRGIIMNVSNPKVALFFLAFLPQFADPQRGSLSGQLILLGGVFAVATLLVFGAIALLAGTLGQWLSRSERVQRGLNGLAGVIFVGLALNLVVSAH